MCSILNCLVICGLMTASVTDEGALNYVNASNGLQSPAMEGGNTELEFGDVDQDGCVDVVSIGDHGSPFVNTGQHGVMVWFGSCNGQWSVVQNGDFGYGGVALGDVNNDGQMDIGYGMHHNYSETDLGDQLLEVALGDGTGTSWTPWDDGLAQNGETWGMFGTDFADIDNDGDLDVGSLSFGCCAGIHIYLNNSDGTWTQSFGVLGGNSSGNQFSFGDLNGDGLSDFVAAHGDGTVYFGDGIGGFVQSDANLPAPSWRSGVSLGDVNDDGIDDLAFRNNDGVQVWTYGDGHWQNLSGLLATVGDFDLTQIVDMNLDGHGDVIMFRPDQVLIYAGDGAAGWELSATINTPDACDTAAFRAGTDVDHNGYPDLAIVSEEACQPFVGGVNRPRVYVEDSIPSAAWIHPMFPTGGETMYAGSVQFVRWHAAVPDGLGGASVDIELSVSGPDGPWTPIAGTIPNNGRYQWQLAAELADSQSAHLRMTLRTDPPVSSVTPGPFHLVGVPVAEDVNGDGTVDVLDLLELLSAWGMCDQCSDCPADLDGNCAVTVSDLLALLAAWS